MKKLLVLLLVLVASVAVAEEQLGGIVGDIEIWIPGNDGPDRGHRPWTDEGNDGPDVWGEKSAIRPSDELIKEATRYYDQTPHIFPTNKVTAERLKVLRTEFEDLTRAVLHITRPDDPPRLQERGLDELETAFMNFQLAILWDANK